MSKYCIIGGGAAGMLAAIHLKDENNKVTLIEKNKILGKKIYITGKGRCNITNDSDPENHINNCMKNRQFLYSALYSYSCDSIVSFFNENGLHTKVERGKRVFPVTDKAKDVVEVLKKVIYEKGIEVRLSEKVTDIKIKENKFLIKTDIETLEFDKVLVTTGGKSYPSTGSDGEFIAILKKLGHNVIEFTPSLTSFLTLEDVDHMAGLTLKNVELNINSEKEIRLFGDLIFTHKGISGPIVLTASSMISDCAEFPMDCFIDLKPAIDENMLDKRILREISDSPNRSIRNLLKTLLPQSLILETIKRLEVDEELKSYEITKELRKKLTDILKRFKLTLKNFTGFKDAVISRGGIDTKEIDPHTMESKLIRGLFFAGEIIDVDSLTGGYNLQIAWSTAYLAAVSMKDN